MKTEVTAASEILENSLKVNGNNARLDNARRDLLSIPNRERPPRIQDTLATLNGRSSSTEDMTAASPVSRGRSKGSSDTAVGSRRTVGSQVSPTLDRRGMEKGIHFVNPLSFVPPPSFSPTAAAKANAFLPASHSQPSKRGLKEARERRLPWSEDFQVLRNSNRHSLTEEPQKAIRTTLEGLVRVGRGGLRVEGRGRLAEPAAHSKQPRISNLRERRRAAAKVENDLSPRNFELDAIRFVTKRLCCPKSDVSTGEEEASLNVIQCQHNASPTSEKAKVAIYIIPRPVCEIVSAPLELCRLQNLDPSLESRPAAMAPSSMSSVRHRQFLVAVAAEKHYAWNHLQPLELRGRDAECQGTASTCCETLEAPHHLSAVQVLVNHAAEGEGSAPLDSILSLKEENSERVEEEEAGDSEWDYYDDEEEDEGNVPTAPIAPKPKPFMGGIPASLLTRWNWNYNKNEESESEGESEDEVDEMSPYNSFEVWSTVEVGLIHFGLIGQKYSCI